MTDWQDAYWREKAKRQDLEDQNEGLRVQLEAATVTLAKLNGLLAAMEET